MIVLIEKMKEDDQMYRALSTGNMDIQKRLDNKNQKILDSLFLSYGYPGRSKVGSLYATYVAFIYLHMDLSFQEKWLPLMIDSYKKEEIDRGYIMYIIDRIHTSKHDKQFFGTQRIFSLKLGGKLINVKKYSVDEQKKILGDLGLIDLLKRR